MQRKTSKNVKNKKISPGALQTGIKAQTGIRNPNILYNMIRAATQAKIALIDDKTFKSRFVKKVQCDYLATKCRGSYISLNKLLIRRVPYDRKLLDLVHLNCEGKSNR